MPDGREEFNVDIVERLADVDQSDWESCAGEDNPFVSYDFLKSLEDSGSVAIRTGWDPRHILIRDSLGQLLACMPLYLKTHSQGEYVFDWDWATVFERAGGRYYPKLLCAVPFTPVTGARLLLCPGLPATLRLRLRRQLMRTVAGLANRAHLSSAHVNFVLEDDINELSEEGFLHRTGLQYHWQNDDYRTYDDFLAALSSRKRKALKKERLQAVDGGAVTIIRLTGPDITERHWDAMYAFYCDTGERKWGQAYLNREFFRLIGERMADKIVLVIAMRGGDIIAGALNFVGKDALYGRYWGCSQDVRFLHFELCYHQAIEAAIELGLKRVEAGAQGEHKIARGYLPTLTHSGHLITDPGFRSAVATFLEQERKAVLNQQKELMKESPYRQDR